MKFENIPIYQEYWYILFLNPIFLTHNKYIFFKTIFFLYIRHPTNILQPFEVKTKKFCVTFHKLTKNLNQTERCF